MKKNNKKGFTIVELVIVIAVIAILASVLIPTFSSVISKAQKTQRISDARNAFTEYMVEYAEVDDEIDLLIVKGDFSFVVEDGQFDTNEAGKATITAKVEAKDAVLYTLAEYNTAKSTSLDADAFAALPEEDKIKTPAVAEQPEKATVNEKTYSKIGVYNGWTVYAE